MVAFEDALKGIVKCEKEGIDYQMTIGGCTLSGSSKRVDDRFIATLSIVAGTVEDLFLKSDVTVMDPNTDEAKDLIRKREIQDFAWAEKAKRIAMEGLNMRKKAWKERSVKLDKIENELKELNVARLGFEQTEAQLKTIRGAAESVAHNQGGVKGVVVNLVNVMRRLKDTVGKVDRWLVGKRKASNNEWVVDMNTARETRRQGFKALSKERAGGTAPAKIKPLAVVAITDKVLNEAAEVLAKHVGVALVRVGDEYDGYIDRKTSKHMATKEGEWVAIIGFQRDEFRLSKNGAASVVTISIPAENVGLFEVVDGNVNEITSTSATDVFKAVTNISSYWRLAQRTAKDNSSLTPNKVKQLLNDEANQRIMMKRNRARRFTVSRLWNRVEKFVEADEVVVHETQPISAESDLQTLRTASHGLGNVLTRLDEFVEFFQTVPKKVVVTRPKAIASLACAIDLDRAIQRVTEVEQQLNDLISMWNNFTNRADMVGFVVPDFPVFPDISEYSQSTIDRCMANCDYVKETRQASALIAAKNASSVGIVARKRASLLADTRENRIAEDSSKTDSWTLEGDEQEYKDGGVLVFYKGQKNEHVSVVVALGFVMIPLAFQHDSEYYYVVRLNCAKKNVPLSVEVVKENDGYFGFSVVVGDVVFVEYNSTSGDWSADRTTRLANALVKAAFKMRLAFYPAVAVAPSGSLFFPATPQPRRLVLAIKKTDFDKISTLTYGKNTAVFKDVEIGTLMSALGAKKDFENEIVVKTVDLNEINTTIVLKAKNGRILFTIEVPVDAQSADLLSRDGLCEMPGTTLFVDADSSFDISGTCSGEMMDSYTFESFAGYQTLGETFNNLLSNTHPSVTAADDQESHKAVPKERKLVILQRTRANSDEVKVLASNMEYSMVPSLVAERRCDVMAVRKFTVLDDAGNDKMTDEDVLSWWPFLQSALKRKTTVPGFIFGDTVTVNGDEQAYTSDVGLMKGGTLTQFQYHQVVYFRGAHDNSVSVTAPEVLDALKGTGYDKLEEVGWSVDQIYLNKKVKGLGVFFSPNPHDIWNLTFLEGKTQKLNLMQDKIINIELDNNTVDYFVSQGCEQFSAVDVPETKSTLAQNTRKIMFLKRMDDNFTRYFRVENITKAVDDDAAGYFVGGMFVPNTEVVVVTGSFDCGKASLFASLAGASMAIDCRKEEHTGYSLISFTAMGRMPPYIRILLKERVQRFVIVKTTGYRTTIEASCFEERATGAVTMANNIIRWAREGGNDGTKDISDYFSHGVVSSSFASKRLADVIEGSSDFDLSSWCAGLKQTQEDVLRNIHHDDFVDLEMISRLEGKLKGRCEDAVKATKAMISGPTYVDLLNASGNRGTVNLDAEKIQAEAHDLLFDARLAGESLCRDETSMCKFLVDVDMSVAVNYGSRIRRYVEAESVNTPSDIKDKLVELTELLKRPQRDRLQYNTVIAVLNELKSMVKRHEDELASSAKAYFSDDSSTSDTDITGGPPTVDTDPSEPGHVGPSQRDSYDATVVLDPQSGHVRPNVVQEAQTRNSGNGETLTLVQSTEAAPVPSTPTVAAVPSTPTVAAPVAPTPTVAVPAPPTQTVAGTKTAMSVTASSQNSSSPGKSALAIDGAKVTGQIITFQVAAAARRLGDVDECPEPLRRLAASEKLTLKQYPKAFCISWNIKNASLACVDRGVDETAGTFTIALIPVNSTVTIADIDQAVQSLKSSVTSTATLAEFVKTAFVSGYDITADSVSVITLKSSDRKEFTDSEAKELTKDLLNKPCSSISELSSALSAAADMLTAVIMASGLMGLMLVF
eukprot:GHVS01089881.1.p1 GENE.GHVS01089881.1~~GHVS01089881.1.p1  ORF type:complete len:1797 (+),score=188.50 GHVS01089881.1:869-6259(+)